MDIINDNILNIHYRLLNDENMYIKVTPKSQIMRVARQLISADYHEF